MSYNEALFRPSEWDDYPLKRDDKHDNKIVQPDFAPFTKNPTSPEPLPVGFEFVNIDVVQDAEMLCVFLNENYDAPHIFDPAHMRWALGVPQRIESGAVIAVRTTDTPRLVGVIAARPVTYRVDRRVIYSLEVGWLCTHRDMRRKRLAAVLMKELYRRAHQAGLSIGMLFALPRQLPALATVGPIRLLTCDLGGEAGQQPNKNIDLVRFANLRDVSRMMKIYKSYATDWRFHREYNRREFEHTFMRRGDVMTYVQRNDRGDVKDFISLYALNERNEDGTTLRVAHVHFVSFLNPQLLKLFMQNILYIMHRNRFARVSIFDLGDVGTTLCDALAFQPTIPVKYMYQFNYNTRAIAPSESQIVPLF